MSESRVPPAPLPRPYLRVVQDDSVSREDMERVKKNLQQTITNLEGELKREREITQKLEKSGEILQEILAAPDFKALSFKPIAVSALGDGAQVGSTPSRVEEPPIEYVPVSEVELSEAELTEPETSPKPAPK